MHKEHDWDIAEVCLKHCKSTVLRMASLDQPPRDEHLETTVEVAGLGKESIDYLGYSDDLASMPWLGDRMLEGFEFDIDDIWDNFRPGSEHI